MNLCEFNELMDSYVIGQIAFLVLYVRGHGELRNVPWLSKEVAERLFTEQDENGRPKMDLQIALWFEEYALWRLVE